MIINKELGQMVRKKDWKFLMHTSNSNFTILAFRILSLKIIASTYFIQMEKYQIRNY